MADSDKSGKPCASCGKPLIGAIVTIADNTYHSDCLKCSVCEEGLADKRTFNVDGKFVCEDCYTKSVAEQCAGCSMPIVGSAVKALGKTWHDVCFVCAACGSALPDKFVTSEERPFCDQECCDKFRLDDPSASTNKTRCRKCKKPIVGSYLEALGGKWHPACFVCTLCSGEFENNKFVVDGDNNPLCLTCGKASDNNAAAGSEGGGAVQAASPGSTPATASGAGGEAGSSNPPPTSAAAAAAGGADTPAAAASAIEELGTCATCGEVVTTGQDRSQALNSWFHAECIKCSHCGKAFEGGKFVTSNDKMYCDTDCVSAANEQNVVFLQSEADPAAGLKCAKCSEDIVEGSMMTAAGKNWHKACFKCARCAEDIGSNFAQASDEVYCSRTCAEAAVADEVAAATRS